MVETGIINGRSGLLRTALVYAGYIGANLAVLLTMLAAAVYLL